MPEMESGSTLPRRQMARILSRLHDRSGLTVKAVSEELELSYQVVWRMLTARPCRIKNWHIDKLCEIYSAPDDLAPKLKMLLQESKAKGWWLAFGDAIPGNFDIYIDLEAAATGLRVYELARIPGLVQTQEYARAMIRSDPKLADDEIERRVQLRMQRQTVLDKQPSVTCSILLDETIARRIVDSPAVMAAQLRHLAEIGNRPNISIRVVPLTAGAYRGIDVGSFRVLEFAGTKHQAEPEPPVVYIEASLGSDLYIDEPGEVQQYHEALADSERSALDEKKSRRLILEIAKELTR